MSVMGYFGPPIQPNPSRFLFLFLNVHSRFRTPSSPRLRFSCNHQRFLFNRFLISRVTVVMAKKRNLAPESSQLVEPPLEQHQSEAQQENLPVQEDDQAFKQSSTSPFGQTNSVFGQNNSSNNPFSPKPFGSTTPFGLQTDSSISGGTSTGVFGAAHTDSLSESILAMPAFKYASDAIRKHLVEAFTNRYLMESSWKQELEALSPTSTHAIGQKPDFRGIGPFGRGTPTSIRKELEAVGGFGYTVPFRTRKQFEAFGLTGAPAFGAIRIYEGEPSSPISVISRPTITEEHGGTSGQTAYSYERFESCVAIAGADYCVIVVDFTRDHTKISELSVKCVMAACRGFQADMGALQVLSAENLKYEGQHKKPMSCPGMYSLFCHVQRSHPIYDFILLGGLDSEGNGCLFQHFRDDGSPQVGYSSQDYGSRPIVHPPIPPILKYKLPTQDVLAHCLKQKQLIWPKMCLHPQLTLGTSLKLLS